MPILLHLFLTLLFLLIIVFCCSLFTNAIEHLGNKLKLGNNATGAILAAIGTTLPETIVPLVAIFGSFLLSQDVSVGKEIAQGAIVGSPFMLSTLALFLLGAVMIFKKQKVLNLQIEDVKRNYRYFIFAFIFVILASFINSFITKVLIAIFLIVFYIVFAYRTLSKPKCENGNCELDELCFLKVFKKTNINYFLIFSQIFFSLIFLAISSHLFVGEIKYFSNILNINPIILSFIVTPFATELPECVNSIIWLKDNKNDLAMANIIGAIVFQATILSAIGILLTSWKFDFSSILGLILTLSCSSLIFLILLIKKQISRTALLLSGIFYFLYFIYLILK